MKVKKSTVDDVRERLAMKKAESKTIFKMIFYVFFYSSEESKGRQNEEEREQELKEEEAKLTDLKRLQRERQKDQSRKRPVADVWILARFKCIYFI